MADIHKKHTEHEPAASAKSDLASGPLRQSSSEASEPKPVVVSDTVTETTERIEVIEEVSPEAKLDAKTEKSTPEIDPLTDFKEKMSEEEEVPVSNKPPKKNYMWPILFIFIIALALLGGIFVYKNSTKSEKVNVVTLSPTPTTIPTPTITVDLSKYPVEILNGSGVDGEAGRQKTNLETEGFTVASVGNADNSDYTETIIQAKATVDQAFLDKLKSVLEKSFVVGEMEELSEDEDSDVIVIIGSETN